ncbi:MULTISPECIES: DUF1622 domain-containing protein [unclassified Roseitalea]|uniref:DUF1622 domain-containing protein n=1 Tax=unclassified Roseitalea TaxID=2639107 RepID=UPI00273D051E|nr:MULTISPECIES: DUF1622 domain-containing protein [unclassified Roseitalea]
MEQAIEQTVDNGLSPMWFEAILHRVALGAEIAGVTAIILGALWAFVRAGRDWADADRRAQAYHTFRLTLARGILLGLEFLVAADIIGTVAFDPTLQNLSVLAVIVLIRTFLSFSLTMEIEGRLPWREK